jgi:hypothetical protein
MSYVKCTGEKSTKFTISIYRAHDNIKGTQIHHKSLELTSQLYNNLISSLTHTKQFVFYKIQKEYALSSLYNF